MRLFEFASDPQDNLVTALELIRQRYKDENSLPSISTDSVIKLVQNTDATFDYDALVAANKTNSAVKNLIKSFDRTKVKLRPFGDEPGTPEEDPTTNLPDPEAATNAVDKMAKRAAKQRGGAI